MDIENTQTDGSSYRSDEDKYDDSFINDDVKVSPKSLGAGILRCIQWYSYMLLQLGYSFGVLDVIC